MNTTLAWGIIGTGNIAKAFARGVAESHTGTLVAVGSRAQETADAFGKAFNVPHCHGSYEALLADPGVQAVYISTPHPMHREWAIKAAEAGKHILCEKPIGINHAEAQDIVEAAARHDVFLMEAFMYRCAPQTAKLVELLRDGVIGEVHIIQAAFSYQYPFDPACRVYNNALAGGGILDVGCYCTTMSRLIAGVAEGGEIAEPINVEAVGHLGPTGIDEYTVGILQFAGNIVAQVSTGVVVNQDNVVRIFGSRGNILIPSPWFTSRRAGTSSIIVQADGKQAQEITITADRDLYTYEADTVAACLEQRQGVFPAMSWEDTLGNMRTLDRWREAIGLVYEAEKAASAK
ncbi:MAG: Gfo/Idh/MocA family protein [Armatimonadota bacterium]